MDSGVSPNALGAGLWDEQASIWARDVRMIEALGGKLSTTRSSDTVRPKILLPRPFPAGITDLKFKPAYNPYTEPSMEIFGYHPDLKKCVGRRLLPATVFPFPFPGDRGGMPAVPMSSFLRLPHTVFVPFLPPPPCRWTEIGNSGMFRPEMLRPMGLPEDVRVIAWGLSLERPTMIKYRYALFFSERGRPPQP